MEMMLPDLTQSGAFFCLVPLVDGVRTPVSPALVSPAGYRLIL